MKLKLLLSLLFVSLISAIACIVILLKSENSQEVTLVLAGLVCWIEMVIFKEAKKQFTNIHIFDFF